MFEQLAHAACTGALAYSRARGMRDSFYALNPSSRSLANGEELTGQYGRFNVPMSFPRKRESRFLFHMDAVRVTAMDSRFRGDDSGGG
jgi:hypothetical protein